MSWAADKLRRAQLSVARSRRAASLFLANAVLASAATSARADCPQMIPLYPTSHVSSAQIEDLTSLVRARPGANCFPVSDQQIQCNASEPVIWWFTQQGHPAHPAASRSQMLTNERTGEACLVRDGYFAGSKRAFGKWLQSLEAHDEEAVQQMRQSLQAPAR